MGWIFAFSGLLGALFAFWLGWHTRHFVAHATRVQAEIVDFIYYPADQHTSEGFYRPIFAFTDASGKSWKVNARTSKSPAAYKRGDKVAVLYSADDPAGARIDASSEIWSDVSSLGFVSGLGMAIGLPLVVWMHMMKGRTVSAAAQGRKRWLAPIYALLELFS